MPEPRPASVAGLRQPLETRPHGWKSECVRNGGGKLGNVREMRGVGIVAVPRQALRSLTLDLLGAGLIGVAGCGGGGVGGPRELGGVWVWS